jgi:hypothetical protein
VGRHASIRPSHRLEPRRTRTCDPKIESNVGTLPIPHENACAA